MELPIKCGKMYIKFDKNNHLEYGFEVKGNQIKKFIPLTDNEIDSIVLPRLVDDNEFDFSSIDENGHCKALIYNQKRKIRDYVTGSVKICDGCFDGLNKAKIIVPFENSIMLDWGSFEKNAEVELVIPDNLTLKQIYRRFDDGFDYERENWTLIADKKITGQFGFDGYGKDDFSILEYNEEDLDYKVANFTIKHPSLEDKNEFNQTEEENIK